LIAQVAASIGIGRIAMHFHDTYGQGVANLLASLEAGVTAFDASVAGLGGCPFAPGATGNVATEDVVFMLDGLGIETGIDLAAIAETGAWISEKLGRANMSRAGSAMKSKI
jgi:hydroxymethylglutaryl-CoA lyase